jgi:hypothetical protein
MLRPPSCATAFATAFARGYSGQERLQRSRKATADKPDLIRLAGSVNRSAAELAGLVISHPAGNLRLACQWESQ